MFLSLLGWGFSTQITQLEEEKMILEHTARFPKCHTCGNPMFPTACNPVCNTVMFRCPHNCSEYTMYRAQETLSSEVFIETCNDLNSGQSLYSNQCFSCKNTIVGNDITLVRDPIRSLGYRCPVCRKTLRDYLIKKGIITVFPVIRQIQVFAQAVPVRKEF